MSFGTALRRSGVAVAAAVLVLVGVTTAEASTTVAVDSVIHGVLGFPLSQAPLNLGPLNTGIAVNSGDTVTISTNPSDKWGINGNYVNSHGAFPIFGSGYVTNMDFEGQPPLEWGSLVYSLDGVLWGYTFTNISDLSDTSITFVAPSSGTVRLAMWDNITVDNGVFGPVTDTTLAATITVIPKPVPEPATIALLAMGVAGLVWIRTPRVPARVAHKAT